MGIWYLKSFIDSNENVKRSVCIQVDLREIVQQWRESGKKAVIVADGHNISRKFKHNYDLISGGEYKSIVQNIKSFIAAFQAIGVDLVFFGGGSNLLIEHRGTIESKKYDRMREKREIEEKFSRIEHTPIFQQESSKVPLLFNKVVKEAISSLCRYVRVSSNRDKRMMQYVIENECLGIFTDDTDLFVYDGVPHVFSGDALNVDEFTTIEYRRGPLLEALGLPGDAMPIFSTLMGNDVVIRHHTMQYHRRKFGEGSHLSDTYLPHKVSTLAEKANCFYDCFVTSQCDLELAVDLLAEEIFETESDRVSQRDRLRQSLLTYRTSVDEPDAVVQLTCQSDWNDLLAYGKQTYATFNFGRASVLVMDRRSLKQSNLEGSSRLCSAQVLAELRRRTYSVLLFEMETPHGETQFVEEVFTSGCRNPFIKYLVSTIPIEVTHPGLYRLWYEDQALDDCRWKLLLWILSFPDYDLNEKMEDITKEMFVFRQPFYQDHFGFVGLVLLYLCQAFKQLRENELTVLFVMTASVPVMNATELQQRSVEYTTQRAVSISTLYQRICHMLRWVVKMCNLKLKVKVCDLYSGLLFHYLIGQDDPTKLLDDLPSQARENYNALRTALDKYRA